VEIRYAEEFVELVHRADAGVHRRAGAEQQDRRPLAERSALAEIPHELRKRALNHKRSLSRGGVRRDRRPTYHIRYQIRQPIHSFFSSAIFDRYGLAFCVSALLQPTNERPPNDFPCFQPIGDRRTLLLASFAAERQR